MPTVPGMYGTVYLCFGSCGWFQYSLPMFFRFGSFAWSSGSELLLLDQRLDRVLGGLDQVVARGAGDQLGEHLLVGGVGLVVDLDAGLLGEAVEHRCGTYSDQANRLSSSARAPARPQRRRRASSAEGSERSRMRFMVLLHPAMGHQAVAALQRLGQRRPQHGDQDEHRRDRVQRRIEALLHAPEDLERQRARAGAGGEVGDDQLVERERERHQRARDDRRHEIRHEHLAEGLHRRRAEIERRLLERRVEARRGAPAPPPSRTGSRRSRAR